MSDDITRNEDRLATAKKLDGDITWAWETWIDSFEDLDELIHEGYYVELGYESGLTYVRDRLLPITDKAKLMANYRQPLIEILVDAGFSNRSIASAIGLSEGTVRRDRKAIEGVTVDDADPVRRGDAPPAEETAGQSVEPVGHIDDDKPQPRIVIMRETTREEEAQQIWDDNKDEEPAEEVDRFAGINFDALILPTPNQIVLADPTPDTPDYFVPRTVAPSWSPPQVAELPPPVAKRYDDDQPEFLAQPMKLEKPRDPNKSDEKHCRTCACMLLP